MTTKPTTRRQKCCEGVSSCLVNGRICTPVTSSALRAASRFQPTLFCWQPLKKMASVTSRPPIWTGNCSRFRQLAESQAQNACAGNSHATRTVGGIEGRLLPSGRTQPQLARFRGEQSSAGPACQGPFLVELVVARDEAAKYGLGGGLCRLHRQTNQNHAQPQPCAAQG